MKQAPYLLWIISCMVGQQIYAQLPVSKPFSDSSIFVDSWSRPDLNEKPGNFQFAIVGDRSGGHRPGVFEDAIRKLNLLQPEFVMSVGDLIEGYTRDVARIDREWKEFGSFVDQLDMPFFYVPGTHDYTNPVMARIWEEKFGDSYYHFVYHDVLFLCLNTEEATGGSEMGRIEKPQFDYVKQVLEEHPDVRWTMVFMHQPLWTLENTGYWEDVEKLLMEREHTVFVSNDHRYVKFDRFNNTYIMMGSTGGLSRLRGPNYGEFDHVAWVTMTEEGPVIANLLLSAIWDDDVLTEELNDLINSSRLKVFPVFIEEPFKSGSFEIHLTNYANYPMTSVLRFAQNRYYSPEIVEMRKEVLPNSLEILDINVSAIGKPRTDRVVPLTLLAYHRHTLEDGRIFELEQQLGLVPVYKVYFIKAPVPIELDGTLEEWPGLPFRGDLHSVLLDNVEAYDGDYDAHYDFNLLYDDDYLYLGLAVWDDKLEVDDEKSLWEQDGLQIYLDARPTIESANETLEQDASEVVSINFAPSDSRSGKPQIKQPELLPEGTRIITGKTRAGFQTEIAIPIDFVVKKAGEDWESIRLNVSYLDTDDSNGKTAIWWRPPWSSDNNYIGSGMFFREPAE